MNFSCLSILMEFVSSDFSGLKSMVTQGVKNPMVDLLSLEDKTLDEVRDVKLSITLPLRIESFGETRSLCVSLKGYGTATVPTTSNPANKTLRENSNSAIIKRFNHHSAMVLAAGLRKA